MHKIFEKRKGGLESAAWNKRNELPSAYLGLLLAVSLAGFVACSDIGRDQAHPAEASTSQETPRDAESEPGEVDHAGGDHPSGDHTEKEHESDLVVLSAEAERHAELKVVPVEKRFLAPQLSTTGQVDFDETRVVHVSPRVSGRVHSVDALLGEKIQVGQKLAEIDSIELGEAKSAFLQAKAREELARQSHGRSRELRRNGITSEQALLESEATRREATAGLHAAAEKLRLFGVGEASIDALSYEERQISIYPLIAPIGGTVIERHATLGELVTPERRLFTLADLSRVWIWIDVYQRDLGAVHLDDQARALVDAFPGEVFEGKVSYLSARVDTDTRTVRARVDMANPGGKLRPGMFVKIEVLDPHARAGEAEGARSLAVPEGAIMREGDGSYIFARVGNGRYRRQHVRVGRRSGAWVEILEGLEADEMVVAQGAFLLKSAASKESLGGGHTH